MEWLVFFDREWEEHSKQDYYLAQIAVEIRRFLEAFKESPKAITLEEGLLKPNKEATSDSNKPAPISTSGRKRIEIGEDAIKDPKWAAVNEKAKAVWMSRLGVDDG